MSKIGHNSIKIWLFLPFYLPWMSCYGSARSCLLIFSARDDSVKVPWKSDVGKCRNQVTSSYFDQLSESTQPLWRQEVSGWQGWHGSKNYERRNWHGLGEEQNIRTSKSTHSKMSILFRCSSNPDDRRPSGFKIHFIAAKLQPPAQNLQIKVKKVKSLEWKEETLEIARHKKLQTRSNNAINWYYVDTVKVQGKPTRTYSIVQFCFNISQTAIDHLPYPTPSFWTSILLSNLGTLHKSTRQLNYCRVL